MLVIEAPGVRSTKEHGGHLSIGEVEKPFLLDVVHGETRSIGTTGREGIRGQDKPGSTQHLGRGEGIIGRPIGWHY